MGVVDGGVDDGGGVVGYVADHPVMVGLRLCCSCHGSTLDIPGIVPVTVTLANFSVFVMDEMLDVALLCNFTSGLLGLLLGGVNFDRALGAFRDIAPVARLVVIGGVYVLAWHFNSLALH